MGQKVRITTKERKRKVDNVKTKRCPNCGGDGVVKIRKKKNGK